MMFVVLRGCALLLFCLLPAFVRAQTDFPGADDKWRHYEAPHFELYSRNSEDMSRDLLHDLELLRAFFLESLKLTERRRLEVTVYYFKSEKDFRAYGAPTYGPKHNFVGFYLSGVDRAVIYLIPGEDAAVNRQTIFHEYIHHLFRVSEQTPPTWFNEGMAELFSTVAPKDGKMEFGHPAKGRLWEAQTKSLMPFEQLFAVEHDSSVFRNDGHTGLFYAQSWALMHYLYFGESKIPAAKRNLFLNLILTDRIQDGPELRAAFQEVFGMDYPEMQKKLERYLRSGVYYSGKIPLPSIPTAKTYAGRDVARAEIQLRLAELAFKASRSSEAKLALLQAAERNPADTRPMEALGADALRDEDELLARERWGRAVEAGTRNPAIYRELGLMEGRAVFSRFDAYYRLPAEKAARLRDYLTRSIQYNPEQTLAYEMLAWVEAFAPEPSIANVTLVQGRYPTLGRKERTALALAFVRVRLGLNEEALEMLSQLETMHLDEWEVYGVEAMRAHIEKRPMKHDDTRPRTSGEAVRMKIAPPKVKPGS
jgi:hypothetical protein